MESANSLSEEEIISEFEKRLIGEPNSSLLWIKYMSNVLRLADVEKAREVAERALRTISFREEGEKINVWVAYMSLELIFGGPTGEANLKRIFARAIVYCDPRTIYLHLARIYASAKKDGDADTTYQTIVKKFSTSCKTWVAYADFLYRRDIGGARKLLQRALQALPKRKHEKISFSFAQLEYRYGSIERGRTLFEGVLASHPKRIDIWSVYATLEENLCGSSSVLEPAKQDDGSVKKKKLSNSEPTAIWCESSVNSTKNVADKTDDHFPVDSIKEYSHNSDVSTKDRDFDDLKKNKTESKKRKPVNYDEEKVNVIQEQQDHTGKVIIRSTNTPDYTRRLYERIVNLSLSSKKAKFFFKRYLEFEKKHGSPATVSHVKDLVRAYVENL